MTIKNRGYILIGADNSGLNTFGARKPLHKWLAMRLGLSALSIDLSGFAFILSFVSSYGSSPLLFNLTCVLSKHASQVRIAGNEKDTYMMKDCIRMGLR